MNRKSKCIIVVGIIMILLGIYLIKYGIELEKNISPVYSYRAEKNDNYEVLLKPNEFYETQKLPAGGYYASKSIEAYILNLKYDFKGNKKAKIEYNYNIIANLVGTVKNSEDKNKEVWNREFVLKDNTCIKQENIENFCIVEQTNIDYECYNELARSYEKNYGIILDTVLKIRLNIYGTIILDGLVEQNEKIEDCIELDIPITNTVSEINENYECITEKEILPIIENIQIYKIIFYVVSGIFIVAAVLIIIVTINNSRKTPKQKYKLYLKRILKSYKELIVTVEKEPNITDLEIMNVCKFEDLIDIAEQTKTNIIHYEKSEKKESKFYVIVNKYVYVYKLVTKE